MDQDIMKSGVVTLCVWTMAPDGQKYLYAFCRNWAISTDKTFPVEGFRSTEKWQLIGRNQDGQVVAVIPGCQVKAFMACDKRPASNDCVEI